MHLRPSLIFVLLALGVGGCAEGQFVDNDGGDPTEDAGDKDVKLVEDTGEEADAALPGEDVIVGDGGGDMDAGADGGGDMDASAPDVVLPEDRPEPIDTGVVDTGVIDTGVTDTGVIDTGPVDTGVIDTGVRDTGPVDTGPVDTGPVDTGVVDSGPTYPPILCPLLGTPIPVTCRSRNNLPPCCGPGGICFCEQRTPIGNFCLPCS